jgi:outer membrane immunogenic protein
VGYDLGHGRLRFGLEAEASDSTQRACGSLLLGGGETGSFCVTAARDLYVGARLGVEIDPGVLFYGKAGYTNFRESISFSLPTAAFVVHPNADGFRLGLGAEFAVGRRTFVKTEYRFSNYEFSQGFDRHQAVIGFGFRF